MLTPVVTSFQSKQLLLAAFFTVFCGQQLFADHVSRAKNLLSEFLQIYNEIEQVEIALDENTKDLDEKRKLLDIKIKVLKQPIFDEEQIQHYKNNVEFPETQIAVNQALIEFAAITDPGERARRAAEYEEQRKQALKEELAAGKPFRKRIDALEKETQPQQEKLENAIKPYFYWPKEQYPQIVRTELDVNYAAGEVRYKWWDGENKYQAFCDSEIKIKENPSAQKVIDRLDDQFPIVSLWPQRIELQIGCMHISFSLRDPDLWDQEKMRQYVKQFVDISGLANLDLAAGQSELETLLHDSFAYSKEYQKIRNERNRVVTPLGNHRVKVKRLKGLLIDPPADEQQIQKANEQIEYYNKERQQYQAYLDAGSIKDPDQRAELLKTLTSEKEKLDAEFQSQGKPYHEKRNALLRGRKAKESLLVEAMQEYFTPSPDGIEGVEKRSMYARVYDARISCSWKSANDDTLCSALLFLRDYADKGKIDRQIRFSDTGGGDKNYRWLIMGNIRLCFMVQSEDWLQSHKVDKLVNKFIDVEGLEQIADF